MKLTLTMLFTMPMVFPTVTFGQTEAAACSKVAEQKITSITLTTDTTDLAVRLLTDESDLVVDNDQLFAKWEITPFNNQNLTLILIDGVEVMREDMLKLKPGDIESFSILKGSDAVAIYGAKDVILVKTKPGFWTSDLVERYKGKLYRKAKTDGSHNQLSEQDTVPFSNKWSGSLVLVDGVELIAEDLDRLKPDDIESLSVVEDSIFTAAYGAKGANSVILIKTKLGFWTPNLIEKYYKDR